MSSACPRGTFAKVVVLKCYMFCVIDTNDPIAFYPRAHRGVVSRLRRRSVSPLGDISRDHAYPTIAEVHKATTLVRLLKATCNAHVLYVVTTLDGKESHPAALVNAHVADV